MDRLEFYTSPDGSIYVKPENGDMYKYDESRKDITDALITRIQDLHPNTFKTLAKIYEKSSANKRYYEYLIVHRFIRCNFGEFDALSYDVGVLGRLNYENVKCPLRGECLYEGLICKPKMETELSNREKEVAVLIARGLSRQEIADQLCISIYTVARHVDNIKTRLHLSTTTQIIAHFHDRE